jgi:hypothetical protein
MHGISRCESIILIHEALNNLFKVMLSSNYSRNTLKVLL